MQTPETYPTTGPEDADDFVTLEVPTRAEAEALGADIDDAEEGDHV
jgi:hypothetical protein